MAIVHITFFSGCLGTDGAREPSARWRLSNGLVVGSVSSRALRRKHETNSSWFVNGMVTMVRWGAHAIWPENRVPRRGPPRE